MQYGNPLEYALLKEKLYDIMMGLVTNLQIVSDCSRFRIYRLQRKKKEYKNRRMIAEKVNGREKVRMKEGKSERILLLLEVEEEERDRNRDT